MRTLLSLIVLVVLTACSGPQRPTADLPTLEHAETSCTAEAYFRWGGLPFGVRVQPVCDYVPVPGDPVEPLRTADGCVVQACIDVGGFVRCQVVAETGGGE